MKKRPETQTFKFIVLLVLPFPVASETDTRGKDCSAAAISQCNSDGKYANRASQRRHIQSHPNRWRNHRHKSPIRFPPSPSPQSKPYYSPGPARSEPGDPTRNRIPPPPAVAGRARRRWGWCGRGRWWAGRRFGEP